MTAPTHSLPSAPAEPAAEAAAAFITRWRAAAGSGRASYQRLLMAGEAANQPARCLAA
mgnify:CR=1 FL=1